MAGRRGVTLCRERLRAARERMGFSQRRLGELTGKHASDISNYETGQARPDPDTARRLADALNVDPLDLMEPGTKLTLKALRLRAGLTQTRAAKRAGVSRSTWAAYERGDMKLPPSRHQQVADALSVDGAPATASEVASAVGHPPRTPYMLPPDLANRVERAQQPGEDLTTTLTRLIDAGCDEKNGAP